MHICIITPPADQRAVLEELDNYGRKPQRETQSDSRFVLTGI